MLWLRQMRKGKLTSDEILAAEKAKDDRVQSRKQGFAKMKERDAGWARFSNGVIMRWHVPSSWSEEIHGVRTLTGNHIPEGCFILKVGKQEEMFDAEEFRKSLRWV